MFGLKNSKINSMKNLYLLPTKKISRLGYLTQKGKEVFKDLRLFDKPMPNILDSENQHIHITSDEVIKEGDWCLDLDCYKFFKLGKWETKRAKKIIITTDPDLIADGVQAIDDDFLNWFIENSECEYAKIEKKQHFQVDKSKRKNPLNGIYYSYKIIIPQEEPKRYILTGDAERYESWRIAYDENYCSSNDVQDLKESYYYKGRRDECIKNQYFLNDFIDFINNKNFNHFRINKDEVEIFLDQKLKAE